MKEQFYPVVYVTHNHLLNQAKFPIIPSIDKRKINVVACTQKIGFFSNSKSS